MKTSLTLIAFMTVALVPPLDPPKGTALLIALAATAPPAGGPSHEPGRAGA